MLEDFKNKIDKKMKKKEKEKRLDPKDVEKKPQFPIEMKISNFDFEGVA